MPRPRNEHYAPLNGPIVVNNWEGSFVFETGICCKISSQLVDGLVVYSRRLDNGQIYPFADVPLIIGSEKLEITWPMHVVTGDEHEVTISCDFCHEFEVVISYIEDEEEMVSKHFGHVSLYDKLRKFKKVYEKVEIRNERAPEPPEREQNEVQLQPMTIRNHIESYNDSTDKRVIVLFDVDSFEVQVHQRSNPHAIGKPCVVANSRGRIVAVSKEAKQFGITRDNSPTVRLARAKLSSLIIIEIPDRYKGRPDTSIARNATYEIMDAMIRFLEDTFPGLFVFEFSSGDEFYVDVTRIVDYVIERGRIFPEWHELWPNTFHYCGSGQEAENRLEDLRKKRNLTPFEFQEVRLFHGALVAGMLVQEVMNDTQYKSSVGVGSNKLVAKIACGIHKPGSVTTIAPSGFNKISEIVKFEDIPGFGGKRGEALKKQFNIQTMRDVQRLTENQISLTKVETNLIGLRVAQQMLKAAHGLCEIPVKAQVHYNTCSVTRNVCNKWYTYDEIKTMVELLCDEIIEKLDVEKTRHHRTPAKLKLTIDYSGKDNETSLIEMNRFSRAPQNGNHLFKLFTLDETSHQTMFRQIGAKEKVSNVKIEALFS